MLLRICAFLIYAFLLAPILIVVAASLTAGNFVTFPPQGLSLQWYLQTLQDPDFAASLRLSLLEATLATLLTLLLVVPAVVSTVRGDYRGKGAAIAFFRMPLNIPRIVLATSLLGLFTVVRLRGTLAGLVVGHVLIAAPLAYWVLSAAFTGRTLLFERAAMTLGAAPLRAFLTTTLRLVAPAVVAAAAFAFIEAFDDVPIALFLSSPTLVTLPVRIYTFVDQSLSPLVPAASSMLIAVVIVGTIVLDRTIGLARIFGMQRKDD